MVKIIGALLIIASVVTMMYGWILNIIWITQQTIIVWSGEMIISAVGIFIVPLGVIMGLLVH